MRPVRFATACSLVLLVLWVAPAVASTGPSRAARMIDQINQARAHSGLRPLRLSSSLTSSSSGFSHSLMSGGRFGHASRIHASARFHRLGEALAMHTGSELGIASTVRQWLASPAHRPILLTRSMRWAGAGVTGGRFHGRSTTIWVLQVGS
jgi:uncharacterized protein YkwD